MIEFKGAVYSAEFLMPETMERVLAFVSLSL